MTGITPDQRSHIEGIVASKFIEAFGNAEQTALALQLINADPVSREDIAKRYPQFAMQFEKMTREEVVENANIWPIAAAVAKAAVFAAEALLPVAAEIQSGSPQPSTPEPDSAVEDDFSESDSDC